MPNRHTVTHEDLRKVAVALHEAAPAPGEALEALITMPSGMGSAFVALGVVDDMWEVQVTHPLCDATLLTGRMAAPPVVAMNVVSTSVWGHTCGH